MYVLGCKIVEKHPASGALRRPPVVHSIKMGFPGSYCQSCSTCEALASHFRSLTSFQPGPPQERFLQVDGFLL
jgi:hypothetical protein